MHNSVHELLHHSDGRPRGFVSGQHLTLRPVMEADLQRLADYMSEPGARPGAEAPLTLQALKKQFEDEKSPGMWGDEKKTYLALALDGSLRGFITERTHMSMGQHIANYHIGLRHEQRDALGCELVALHLRLLNDWQRLLRVEARALEEDQPKRAWLEAAGFELEFVAPRSVFHLGQAVGLAYYSWLSPELKALPGWSEGEPDYARRPGEEA